MLLARAGLVAAAGGVAPPVAEVNYAPTAAVFDGVNDFVRQDGPLIDVADTKFFACTFTIKRAALTGNTTWDRIAGGQIGTAATPGSTRWSIGFEPSNHLTPALQDTLFVELRNVGGTAVLVYLNSTTKFLAGIEYKVGVSVDRNTRTYKMRVVSSGADVTTFSFTDSADTAQLINYATLVQLTTVGGRYNQDQPLNGEIADLWIDINRAPDFTLAAEWEKFFAPTTHALQWKGNDGSVPYGAQPLIFMSGPIGVWHVNSGYGEGFTPGPSTVLAESISPPAGAVIPQFALSDVTLTVTGTNAVIANQGSDNWPTAWASDGNQVTCWGDGNLPDTNRASMGMARVSAATYAAFVASPTFAALATTRSSGRGAGVNRITFVADTIPNATAAEGGKCYGLQALPGGLLYALVGAQDDDGGDAAGGQDSNGQMENLTLIKSTNNGASWTHVPGVSWNTNAALNNAWVLPGALNMGRANAAAQDEFLYWYAGGARPLYTGQATDFAYGSDDMMLVRVRPGQIETVDDWQVFTGMSGSTPQWSSLFTSWAPVPGLSLAAPLNNQYPNAFYLSEFDEIIVVRNTNGRESWSVTTATHLQFLRSTSRRPWGPFELVEQFTDWRPYDPDVPGAASSARGMFFFEVPSRWVPKATGTTTRTISTALVYTGRNKGASGTFWDAWNSVPMTLTLTAAAGPVLTAPVNTALPTISPTTPVEGELVTALPGSWSGNPAPSFTFQMLRNGANISGATASGVSSMPYTPTTADSGAAQPSLAVRVTASNGVGSPVSATSIEYTVSAEVVGDVNLTPTTPNINTVISGAAVGDVISFGPGTYTGLGTITPKNNQTYVARDGPGTVILDGNQLARRAFNGQFGPTNVTLRGLIVTNYWSGFQIGGSGPTFDPIGGGTVWDGAAQASIVHVEGPDDDSVPAWVIEDCEVIANYGVGIRAGNGTRISRCEISDNAHLGVAGPRYDMILEDSSLRNNCRWHMNAGDEGGAVKWGGGSTPSGWVVPRPPNKGHIVRRCKIANNYGSGLWWDWDCVNSEIHNNSIWGNTFSSILLECCGGFHVHHNQLDSPVGAGGYWSFRTTCSLQNTKKTVVENNLAVVNTGADAATIGSQNRGSGGGPQGGVYVGWFTGTQNVIRGNVYLMVANGEFSTDFQTHEITNNVPSCTGYTGASMDGVDSLTDAPPNGEIVREWNGTSFTPGVIATSNFKCFLPDNNDDHLNVSTNNTYRMAGSTNPTRWSFDTAPTIVLSANPASSVPDWEVIPTWTTPPGK